MNLPLLARILAALLLILDAFLLFPTAVAVALGEAWLPLAATLAGLAAVGGGGLFLTRNVVGDLRPREGFLVVTLGWLAAVTAGALPFHAAGLLGWVDALFEASAGFTTTGSSVLTDIESWPRGLLLWRSLIQWLGGMGMLLLAVAVLPFLGVGGLHIVKAEVPGPNKDRLTPRLISTARILWGIYCGFTLLAVLAYHLTGMDWLEAVSHAFTTLSTGGFSTRNASLAAFSPATQWVAILFMAVGGTNFVIHYHLLAQRDASLLRLPELHLYLGLLGGAGLLVAGSRLPDLGALEPALREGLFQVVSVMTTTGYATADYVTWPFLVQGVLAGLMVIGGMSGSTAGGGKVIRAMVLAKTVAVVFRRQLNPFQVVHLRVGDAPVSRDLVEACVAVLLLSVVILGGTTTALNLLGLDPVSAFGAALTCLSNVGPGFGALGPSANFAAIPDGGKLLLSLVMIVGRLEIVTVALLFTVGFWRT